MADPIVGTDDPESLDGTKGDDTIFARGGRDAIRDPGGNDLIDGGLGNDYLYYTTKNLGITVDLQIKGAQNTGGAGTDTLVSIENLYANTGTGNDSLAGTDTANWLFSFQGNDTLLGRGGNDWLMTADGVKIVDGGAGIDTYSFNTVRIGSVFAGATLSLALQGQAQVSGTLTITLSGIENLAGSLGEDVLTGDAGKNTLVGGSGDDQLFGGEGSDTLAGDGVFQYDEFGKFTFYPVIGGPVGDDYLDGGSGGDTMYGGLGDDTYVVDDTRDKAIEDGTNGYTGNDTVRSSVSFVLGDLLDILRLTGTANIAGTGNTLANAIYGNDGDNLLNGVGGGDRIEGGLGDDTYLFNFGDTIVEDTEGGIDTVRYGAGYTLGANFENLVLTGTVGSNLNGNNLANTITGNVGNDVIDGRGGADTMIGGKGDDTYLVDTMGDTIIERGGSGTDLVSSTTDFSLAELGAVENLTLRGSTALNGTGNGLDNLILGTALANQLDGGAGDDTLRGARGADTLVGGTGDDFLDGGEGADVLDGGAGNDRLAGGAGIDQMRGGAGNDLYYVDAFKDVVTETAGEGRDTVSATSNYALSDNIEDLVLTGANSIDGTGNALANTITGNDFSNVLDGGGGADRLIGGGGADTFIVDDAGDTVEGTGTIKASISYKLNGDFTLILTGAEAIGATGNDLSNTITGNKAANTIQGLGGNDLIDGGAGDDVIRGDAGADTLLGGAGKDSLQGGADGDTIEGGAGDDTLRGEDGADQVSGGAGNDTLMGGAGSDRLVGGAGADTMNGGAGGDIYFVDSIADKAIDSGAAGDGLDVVYTDASFVAGSGIEVITAFVLQTGREANIDLTGNGQDNFILGGYGNNRLDGGGGDDILLGFGGADTLIGGSGDDFIAASQTGTGGEGADTFGVFFNFAPTPIEEAMAVTDFVTGADKIAVTIDSSQTPLIPDGALASGFFVLGTEALEADDRVIYDKASGQLWLDIDGTGARAAQHVANLGAGTELALGDIVGLSNQTFFLQNQAEYLAALGVI